MDERHDTDQYLTHPFRLQTTVFRDGERCPALVGPDGIPLFDPTVWSVSLHRHKSASTMEQALRGALLLLVFCRRHGVDLDDRIESGTFLDLGELDLLAADAVRPLADLRVGETSRNRHFRSKPSTSVVRLLRRLPGSETVRTVEPATMSIRMHYLVDYLKWLGNRQKAKIASEGRDGTVRAHAYGMLLDDVVERILERTPGPGRRAERVGLAPDQLAAVLGLTEPDAPDNPWRSPFVRVRNHLIVRWLLATGMRRGELLGLRISDFDRQRGRLAIKRRQDDRIDPRSRQPNAKTLERIVPLNETWVRLGEAYLEARKGIQGARSHPFLFVAEDGAPLSLAVVTDLFGALRTVLEPKYPDIDLSAHVLRHQWNEDFSDYADRIGLAEEDEIRERCWLMGWSPTSPMPHHYLRRRTKAKADEHSRRMQDDTMCRRLPENSIDG